MRLIGFDFTKILAEKSDKFNPEFSTSTNIDIADIAEEKGDFLKNFKIIKVEFKFGVIYAPKDNKELKFGEISLAGHLVFSAEEKEAAELLESWKKKDEKSLPQAFRIPLFNLIMRKCAPKSLELEDSLGLPFHIPVPQLKVQVKEKQTEEKAKEKKEKEESKK